MPRGRMLDKRISESKKLVLVDDKSRVIYFMLLPHLDKNGCFKALPGLIKWTAMPNIEYSEKQIEASLKQLDKAKLLVLYKVNDDMYLHYVKFRDFQTNDISREGKSDIPLPNNELLKTYSGVNQEEVATQDKDKDKEEDKGEDKRVVFKKPTAEQITDYTNEKLIHIDVEAFLDYYESNGWKVGRNSMKDWQATVRRWAKNSKPKDNMTKAQRETMKSLEDL
uniref:Uncharacterized protein n=1 Tax=viral metagenome TaxID=1070528 RepID=A0A6M3KNU1_9ZZZZ